MTPAANTDPISRPANPAPQPLPPPPPKKTRAKRKTTSKKNTTVTVPPVPNESVSQPTEIADTLHHPLPDSALAASTIDILEDAANQAHTSSHNRNSTTLPSATQPVNRNSQQSSAPGPLEGLHESLNAIAPKKSRKRLRTCEEDGRPRQPAPLSVDELMTHSVAELVAEARKRSKGAMSESDRMFFVDYFEEQRKMMVIKAIEKQVSMEMVDTFLGKRQAIRRPNKWNRFLQTVAARKKFRGAGRGVGSSSAMAQVSALYKRKAKLVTTGDQPEAGLTPSELALDDDPEEEGSGLEGEGGLPDLDEHEETDVSVSGGEVAQRGTISLARAARQVEDFLRDWAIQANTIAQTCNCEMICFAVSTHLGPNSYQLTKSTHRATPFVDLANDSDQPNTYQARFQASLVGLSVSEMINLMTGPRRVRNRPPKVTTPMNKLIASKTENIMTQWPWTDNEARLAAHGFQLVLDPRMRTPRENLQIPSRSLKVAAIKSLLLDLADNYIDVVRAPVSSSVSQAQSSSTNNTTVSGQNSGDNSTLPPSNGAPQSG
ncbi:hypothetical protein PGT21_004874 [Puccinia graminis f. sp. tritici]|uniref:Uncharacterized protein n=1 Tax=Puccinia graminis f. sp. tritici TaxID=56615 RepID=A0A5B0Q1Q5_PUCGR|nr:hypothetical protein PGT21_004874 [Puccinia graminis f. sp. tritici]KAA1137266.1 hypothetical protein PGTUg99_014803 [Puccinia graminis f. sp. tritici]